MKKENYIMGIIIATVVDAPTHYNIMKSEYEKL